MSKYFSQTLGGLKQYVPGEQLNDKNYIKLNTNENPYFPSKYSVAAVCDDVLNGLRLYSDPENSALTSAIASYYGVDKNNVLATNGSDEALAFCFAAFGDRGVVFPDVTYGFYKVFAALFGAEQTQKPLKKNFTIDVNDYLNVGKTVFIANPNAQTGLYLDLSAIEKIVASNKGNVVVIDEAYIDFGGTSAVGLINKYDNLALVQTFSKSRSLAGARVGFAVANEKLIEDLKRIKFSFNPYSVNSVSERVAAAAISDVNYFDDCRKKVISSRSRLINALEGLRFTVLPSLANFVLAKSATLGGEYLYNALKAKGILVRYFDEPRIKDYVRITVGTDEQIDALIDTIKNLESAK